MLKSCWPTNDMPGVARWSTRKHENNSQPTSRHGRALGQNALAQLATTHQSLLPFDNAMPQIEDGVATPSHLCLSVVPWHRRCELANGVCNDVGGVPGQIGNQDGYRDHAYP